MIRPLEPVVQVVTLATKLPMITIGPVSSVTIQPILVDKMVSSVSSPPALVVEWQCLGHKTVDISRLSRVSDHRTIDTGH